MRPRQIALGATCAMVASVQFSIAISQIFLTVAVLAWATTLIAERRWPSAPAWALPLGLYMGWTLVSALFSIDPPASLVGSKQLVLFVIVPIVYDVVDEATAVPMTTLILVSAAASALVGIVQYAVLHYDNLGQRPSSTVGLYMTFSGLMMLSLNLAIARAVFPTRSRMWPVVVMPALAVALALTFARNAWVGWFLAVALLLVMRDFRLAALLPIVAALFFALAPAQIVQRFYSIFDKNDPTRSDRVTMIKAGIGILRAKPLTGVGPHMIPRAYPQFSGPDAILKNPPHLHNVPLQIAAERGLPALAFWGWGIVALGIGARRIFSAAPRGSPLRFLSAASLTAVVAMLGAGMFEHNFGDSEFLMLFLVIVTLPFAAARRNAPRRHPA